MQKKKGKEKNKQYYNCILSTFGKSPLVGFFCCPSAFTILVCTRCHLPSIDAVPPPFVSFVQNATLCSSASWNRKRQGVRVFKTIGYSQFLQQQPKKTLSSSSRKTTWLASFILVLLYMLPIVYRSRCSPFQLSLRISRYEPASFIVEARGGFDDIYRWRCLCWACGGHDEFLCLFCVGGVGGRAMCCDGGGRE